MVYALTADGIHNIRPTGEEEELAHLNGLDFQIGGIIDNTVGYYFFLHEEDVPEMTPGRMIMLRDLGDGWYLYKTT